MLAPTPVLEINGGKIDLNTVVTTSILVYAYTKIGSTLAVTYPENRQCERLIHPKQSHFHHSQVTDSPS
jgi:hypothetical protein